MATIKIHKGDSATLTETITGIASLSGYTAKLYIKDKDNVAIGTLTGTIDTLTITYLIVNESSKAYTIGEHFFETKVFDSSDHVGTPSEGAFIVDPALTTDPS